VAPYLRPFWLAIGLLTTQCAPEAKSAACRNDGDCPDAERGRAYCVRRHCVECITRASCGPHMTCAKGQCVPG
jgi:hypothetical protein